MFKSKKSLVELPHGVDVPVDTGTSIPAAAVAGRSTWNPKPHPLWGALLVAPMLILVGLLVFYPVTKLLGLAFPDGMHFGTIEDYFSNDARLHALIVTLRDSLAVTVLAIGFGYPLAWVLRFDTSKLLRLLVWSSVMLPFLMGTVAKNYAFVLLLARRGIVNNFLVGMGFTSGPLPLLFNEIAVVIGILYTMLPYAVIPLYVALLTIDRELVSAAKSLGASGPRAAWTVVVPLSLPSTAAVAILVFVISLGFYVTPVVLGGAASPFMATLIQNDMVQFFDLGSAAISALLLILVAGATVLVSLSTLGSDRMRKATGRS